MVSNSSHFSRTFDDYDHLVALKALGRTAGFKNQLKVGDMASNCSHPFEQSYGVWPPRTATYFKYTELYELIPLVIVFSIAASFTFVFISCSAQLAKCGCTTQNKMSSGSSTGPSVHT